MDDIRLDKMTYEFNGKTYELEVNYNVLADLQNEFGQIPDVFEGKNTMRVYTALMAAMINDYADTMKWGERITPREFGRTVDTHNLPADNMMKATKMLMAALFVPKEQGEEAKN